MYSAIGHEEEVVWGSPQQPQLSCPRTRASSNRQSALESRFHGVLDHPPSRMMTEASAAMNLPAAVFADQPTPDGVTLHRKRFFSNTGFLCDGCKHHDEFEFGINEDRLAVDTQQGKPSLLSRVGPELIAVSKIRRGSPRRESIGLPMPIGRFEQILFRHDLPGANRAVIGQQHAETPVVAQDGRADFETIGGPDP